MPAPTLGEISIFVAPRQCRPLAAVGFRIGVEVKSLSLFGEDQTVNADVVRLLRYARADGLRAIGGAS